jgi:hypothetical protein
MDTYVFPKWTNFLRPALAIVLGAVPIYTIAIVYFGFSPGTRSVGYQPEQPVPYSHAVHAGELGIDCRYCHTSVESAAHATIPPTQTCMNCHKLIRTESEKLAPVRNSYETGLPVEWVRVHNLPDFVYFDHSAHVRRGVGCVSCHGRVDKMEVVSQVEPLTMGWCLECHRDPDRHLRPVEYITQLDWVPEDDALTLGRRLRDEKNIHPSDDCSTCHR